MASCSPKTKVSNKSYTENIEDFVPNYEPNESEKNDYLSVNKQDIDLEPTNEINESIESQLDVFSEKNYEFGISEYTIQVYVGRSRELAKNAKRKIYSVLPDSEPFIQWSAPLFRVKVGSFYNSIEAMKDLNELKKKFPSAIIIPEKVKYTSQK